MRVCRVHGWNKFGATWSWSLAWVTVPPPGRGSEQKKGGRRAVSGLSPPLPRKRFRLSFSVYNFSNRSLFVVDKIANRVCHLPLSLDLGQKLAELCVGE